MSLQPECNDGYKSGVKDTTPLRNVGTKGVPQYDHDGETKLVSQNIRSKDEEPSFGMRTELIKKERTISRMIAIPSKRASI